ncbi:MAG TPA: 3-oxoacyl-[acyl-carrier-protein] synthase III C-terminal domain-containing protein, partial [Pirellulales bacterium]
TFMRTDSEQLMLGGVETGRRTFAPFLSEVGWSREQIDKTICHQVGVAHRKLLFETLGLDESLDYSTFETLGNTGAAALPLTMALAAEAGRFAKGDRVAMLGIGSGINCQMLGVEW